MPSSAHVTSCGGLCVMIIQQRNGEMHCRLTILGGLLCKGQKLYNFQRKPFPEVNFIIVLFYFILSDIIAIMRKLIR